jgi:hypothetical protein
MAKVDFGGLKQKLMTSIVAISAIQVLKAFMNIERYDSKKIGLAGIHVLFRGRPGRPAVGRGPAFVLACDGAVVTLRVPRRGAATDAPAAVAW